MIMRDLIAERVILALETAQSQGLLPVVPIPQRKLVERPQNSSHGDFATSVCLKLARSMQLSPLQIANCVKDLIQIGGFLEGVDVVSPGFINFRLEAGWVREQVATILEAGDRYGDASESRKKRIQVEFVSVNPTGPLHVGHARGAVLGSTLAAVLSAAGYEVVREYYINDAGSQMDAFYQSLEVRYREALGQPVSMPTEGYHGKYLSEIGTELAEAKGTSLLSSDNLCSLPELADWGLTRMLKEIRDDLGRIGVEFDVWFSERSLYDGDVYGHVMKELRSRGYLTDREGATWFASRNLGEDKDNVLIRRTGAPTYFASDAAYHYDKFLIRGFEHVVNIWGADHQGHISRLKAILMALDVDPNRLTVLVSQMVMLRRQGEVVRVSKRTGEIITLRDLVDEVGPDACRYFFLARSPEAQMEFDMDLALRQSQENPVYYIQYAHARAASILRTALEQGLSSESAVIQLLASDEEMDLVKKMLELPEIVDSIASTLEPHHMAHYTLELATAFHWFYDRCRVITEDQELSKARISLVMAAKAVLGRCLRLMGMTAPDQM